MTRRIEIGPLLVVLAALVLLVSLFLDWYGVHDAWSAFELTDLLLAALAVAALVTAAGLLAPELSYLDRRLLPAAALAIAVIVAVQLLSPPPAAGGADPQEGAWLGFGAALALLVGTLLSMGHVSFSVAVEGRERRQRVAAVDNRQDTTESAALDLDDTGDTAVAGETAPGSRREP